MQLQNHKVQRLARGRLFHVNTSESFEAKISFKSELSHENTPSVKNHDSLAIKCVALAQHCMGNSKQGQGLHLCKKYTPGRAQSQLCCSPALYQPEAALGWATWQFKMGRIWRALCTVQHTQRTWGPEPCARLCSFPLPYLPVCWCRVINTSQTRPPEIFPRGPQR